jgi:hypothetical protein
MNSEWISQFLGSLYFLGLMLLPLMWFARNPSAVRRLFWLALFCINLGGLWILLVMFLVTRLDGSGPPSLAEVFWQGLWIPTLILLLSNLAAFGLRRLKR